MKKRHRGGGPGSNQYGLKGVPTGRPSSTRVDSFAGLAAALGEPVVDLAAEHDPVPDLAAEGELGERRDAEQVWALLRASGVPENAAAQACRVLNVLDRHDDPDELNEYRVTATTARSAGTIEAVPCRTGAVRRLLSCASDPADGYGSGTHIETLVELADGRLALVDFEGESTGRYHTTVRVTYAAPGDWDAIGDRMLHDPWDTPEAGSRRQTAGAVAWAHPQFTRGVLGDRHVHT